MHGGATDGSPSGAVKRELYETAEAHLRAARYDDAWAACETLLPLTLAEGRSWRARAVAARVLLEWGKASEEYEHEERLDRLGRAVTMFDAALVQLRTALAGSEESVGAASTDVLTEASTDDLAELINDRGVALYELDDLSGAAAAFDETLALRPRHERALCNSGLVHWASGHERVALSKFDDAIASGKGSNPHSLNNRGALKLETLGGGVEAAAASLNDFHAALLLDPAYETARRNRDSALTLLAEPVPLSPVADL